ncbi:glycosyltransferase [Bacteroides sedimenti]|uniref:Glycosyl transferase n=1 Tax=Bacteroides sedimenti TaxID=2136147 RepID=A0ABM8IBC0_9BACE
MIGLFNDCFPPIMDGVSLTTQNYAHWLNRKTGNVCVVTPKSPHVRDNEEYPVYRYSSLPIPMRKPYRFGVPQVDLAFQYKLNQISFELVHAHCPFSSGALAMRIAKSQNIPLVATFHSKYKADFERAIPNKKIVDYLIKDVIRFYEGADEVWIPQASVEETLREYGYKGKVEVVDNGNDFSDYGSVYSMRATAREELGVNDGEFVFLFVGQHIFEKNLAFLLESLAIIRYIPYKMYFIGSGYAEGRLKQMTEELNLSSKVFFVGTVSNREQLSRYYAAADLFLFPSLYDNAPLVVREAAALHTPSVLISGSTSAAIVTDSVNGFLASHSTADYARKIRELTVSPLLMRMAGDKASHSIARSWENVVDEVCDRYQCLMRRTSCNHPDVLWQAI